MRGATLVVTRGMRTRGKGQIKSAFEAISAHFSDRWTFAKGRWTPF